MSDFSENRTIISWVVLVAFLFGIAIVASDVSRLAVFCLALALPLLFTIAHKSLVFILKCMVAVVFFIPFSSFDFLNPFKILNPLVILGLILGMKFFLQPAQKREPRDHRLKVIDRIYFVFLFSALISSFCAISILGSLNWIFYSVTTGYFVYRVILMLDFQEIRSVLRFFVFAASLSALYGIGEYAAGYSLIYGHLIQGRLTSLLGHPVAGGLIFATVFPFSLALGIETREKIFIMTSGVLFAAVLFSFARGSWLALSAGLLVMFAFFRFQFKSKLILTVFILAALAAAAPVVNQSILKRLNQNESDRHSSFNARRASFPIAFSIIKDKPFFGGGPFNSIRYKEKYSADLTFKEFSLENSYLDFLVDVGWVGFGILVLLAVTVLKIVASDLLREDRLKIYRVISFVSLTILLVNMFTFNFDSYRLFHFFAWFYIGLNIAFTHLITRENNL